MPVRLPFALRPFQLWGLFLLAGCVASAPDGSMLPPPNDVAPPEPAVSTPSAQTLAAREYYARVEANYLDQELLRTDDGGIDAPFTAAELAENFVRIAFYEEFSDLDGTLVPTPRQSQLHRWETPIKLAVEFSPSVAPEQRSTDRAEIASYIKRLSRLTGVPIRMTTQRADHTVLVLNADEREAAADRLSKLAPGISEAALRSVTRMKPDIYCTVFGFTRKDSPVYFRAVTVIRGELPDRLRLACIHEELAQSLGLISDYPRARPSIFNDNEEFALLTRQDELMLRMLYDPRLKPGMTLDEARPIIARMANEILGGDS